MIHHPVVWVPKLVVLGIIIAVLVVLHGILPPSQFKVAVAAGVVLFLAASVAIWVIGARVLANPDSRLAKATVLFHQAKSKDGFRASSDEYASLVGKLGIAVSNLAPSGTALVEGKRIPVMSDGEFIEADAAVEVVAATGFKVVVKRSREKSGG